MRCELLRAPHDHTTPPDIQHQFRRDSTAHSQVRLDPVAELFDGIAGVLRQNFENVAADEVGVGFRVYAEHVNNAGRKELDDEGVVG